MRRYKYIFIFIIAMHLCSFTGLHKFYLSVTEVEYVKEKESVQIISRIFIDDFERLIQERYDEAITLTAKGESQKVNIYIERYLKSKMLVNINGKPVTLNYLGKEYEEDIVYCYLEIEGIKEIKSFEISNETLFDLFDDQQNIVKLKMNEQYKSFLLTRSDKTTMLKFD